MEEDDSWILPRTFWEDKRTRETYFPADKTHRFFTSTAPLGRPFGGC